MLYDYIMMASLVKKRGRRENDVVDSPISWFVVVVLFLRRYDLNFHPPTMDLTTKKSYSQ
jgi:hypothetical protein